ncbi:ABC transporter ATP-binding protein [Clostridium sp. HBUAS56010]|uniref:ABC transporter ATP-binding protein n=1 Tax=Clostridium sp. HBUAS56010 TaxID=2571127 RepID=UPI001178118B|nr:ABC transporter ATP-binding protein [Clostridium sp. HBUAS56010]
MIHTLLSSLREYKRDTIKALIYLAIESIVEISIPTVMAFIIDYGINAGNMKNVLLPGLVLVLAALFCLWIGLQAARASATASTGLAKNLRYDMFSNIQKFSFLNIDRFSTASLITRLTTDVTNIQNSYMMAVRLGMRSPMLILFALIFSFRIDARLSIIFVVTMPILVFALWLIVRQIHPIFMKVFRKYDELNNVVQENLLGIRVVKSYNREDHERNKFAAISEAIFQNYSKGGRRTALNMPIMQLCMYVCITLLSWFGAKEILASGNDAAIGLSTGGLTTLILYATQILMSLMMISMVFTMMLFSRASAQRIVEVLLEKSDIHNPENPVHTVKDGSITFENVRFSYSARADKPVLNNINLSIASGQTVGILGGTGSSKSSLVQLIPRLYDVTGGRVTVGGVDVLDYDISSLRDQVAMVLQKNVLFSGTIKENLRWGNENATDEELVHACQLAQADDFIRSFPDQYDTYIEQGGSNVSGGQKQRLCIARALLKKPKILILDDSTSAVDTKTDQLIRKAFKENIPDITKIIIAQRTASIEDADQIVVLDDGMVNAVGTHEELLETCSIYREVYESQNKGGAISE